MKKCYGYIRVSTNYQVDDGFSLEFQEKEIRNYVKTNNCELIKIFFDKGKSGREMNNRKELQNVLEIMKKGDILLFYSLSRLSRSARDYHNIKDKLEDKGCSFVSIKEKLETVTPMGKCFAGMTALMDELESNNISERVKDGMKMKKEKGERIGRIPYGWKTINGQGTELIEDEEKQEVIKTIKKMREEKITSVKVIKYLEDNKIPPPKASKKWYPSTIGMIVKRKEVNTKGREVKV
jgi:site-specific DNA recombinase